MCAGRTVLEAFETVDDTPSLLDCWLHHNATTELLQAKVAAASEVGVISSDCDGMRAELSTCGPVVGFMPLSGSAMHLIVAGVSTCNLLPSHTRQAVVLQISCDRLIAVDHLPQWRDNLLACQCKLPVP